VIKWQHWPRANPGMRNELPDEYVGQSEFGTFRILRTSYKTLGEPWRVTYPSGNTARAANVEVAKKMAERWLVQRYQDGGAKGTDERTDDKPQSK
jgi:hypothetical protein